MKNNNKGQALVEFILMLPVILILLFCVVDFGRVISLKNTLESNLSDAVVLYQNGNSIDSINNIPVNKDENIKISLTEEGEYVSISANKKIDAITPGLSYILKDVFDVKVTRVIKNEAIE